LDDAGDPFEAVPLRLTLGKRALRLALDPTALHFLDKAAHIHDRLGEHAAFKP
jgi:hypothetical protein